MWRSSPAAVGQRARRAVALGLALAVAGPSPAAVAAAGVERRGGTQGFVYRPTLAVSDTLQPFLAEIGPGSDLVPDERVAKALLARLAELSGALRRSGPAAAESIPATLLAASFRGARLRPVQETVASDAPALQVVRGIRFAAEPTLGPRSFARELRLLLEEMREIACAELLLVSLELGADGAEAKTQVRYDIAGPGRQAWRAARTGTWAITWRRSGADWSIVEWRGAADVRSSASAPVFSEITRAAFGGNDSFGQLATGLDVWASRVDSVLTRDSNAHNGVAVGDADGDSQDDVYVAQPHGFPNRLFRARGDGTFEDVTERAGLGLLEDTSHALFADVDNDGDQDLIATSSSGPALFLNTGRGEFTRRPDAFVYQRPLQGAPMSLAVADYDRDGFLDLYLSVYSFYYGAGEGKGGTPVPYHDAENGPPNVLFRNDGHGRFVDVTRDVGLDAGNDRFSFAAAWGDYDEDGWPDLVVTNDFGRKNLYRNLGRQDGEVRFEDVTTRAGVEDHAAGMSISWLDFDGDGRLDIYAGQMWSENGLRVTHSPAFMPAADARVRALYHRHARGNSLFRNRGDGTFEDVTLPAGVEMGRWSWSTGALDLDSDGSEDLYAVNGMVTRQETEEDLDWFFWGGIIARSPLGPATGTPYDEAWRAINRLMAHRSIAGRQRNALLRSDGRGRFDDVSGTTGLDLDQDGRAFAVFDCDQDGDPDLLLMAPRDTPQLRLLRNDYLPRGATLAVRLVGAPASTGNRDAIGARVIVETDRMRRTKTVSAGSGFLSQHSKELLFGLGASQRVVRLTVAWPSGRTQVVEDVPLNHRVSIEEGQAPRAAPYASRPPLAADTAGARLTAAPSATWLYEPAPVPDFVLPDLGGETRSLAALRGRPAVLLFWSRDVAASREALAALAAGQATLAEAGVGALALALDAPGDNAKVRAAAAGLRGLPVLHASDEVARSQAILHRHLFLHEPDLELPTAFLLDAQGRVARVYRDRLDVAQTVDDAARIEVPAAERLARALPFPGQGPFAPGERNEMAYGRELQDQGLEAPALAAFERAAQGRPSSATLYRIGTLLAKSGESAKARTAFERALAMQPDLAEAANDLGTLLAQAGEMAAAIDRFRAALAAAPDYPDALNNLGYALLLSGDAREARALYEKALALQPDFPDALNNLGLLLARDGRLAEAEPLFRRALQKRHGYVEAANNLALALHGLGRTEDAVETLQQHLARLPSSESSAVTLAKLLMVLDRGGEALAVIDRLLQRNPGHPEALELARALR